MGLRDLIPDDAGDNRGGRPPSESKGPKKLPGKPFTVSKDSKEFWQEVWDRFVSGNEPTMEEIGQMADYTHVFPWDLKIYIEKWDIFEFDWDHMPEDYPSDSFLAEMLEDKGIENDFTERVKAEREGYSQGSGLFSLVENAKGEDAED